MVGRHSRRFPVGVCLRFVRFVFGRDEGVLLRCGRHENVGAELGNVLGLKVVHVLTLPRGHRIVHTHPRVRSRSTTPLPPRRPHRLCGTRRGTVRVQVRLLVLYLKAVSFFLPRIGVQLSYPYVVLVFYFRYLRGDSDCDFVKIILWWLVL